MAKTKAKNADTRGLPGKLNKTVRPVHFEDFSWKEFEHLTYAHVRRQKQWDSLDWLGQSGNDQGRDLWGKYNSESYCYNCANHSQLKLKKITDDIDKLFNERFIPDNFIVVSGGNVSATLKGKIKVYAVSKGIKKVEVYSGKEFEEQLRMENPDLLKRFVDGQEFPELNGTLQLDRQKNETPEEVLQQIRKYRSTKKMEELESIINSLFLSEDFENNYGEKLEEIIFTDAFLIEYFASNSPDILIEFSKKHPGAAINNGDQLFHILSGLFSDKSNPIYAEIRQYKNENEKTNIFE